MALKAGSKLGPYEIVGLLGAGGMGEVYRARDSRLKREVAVKVLPQSISAEADRLHRFEQEALATAALNHPNILAVFDIGVAEGAPYAVSELLEGETLRDRLRSGAIPVRKALDYALQITRGLAAAHEKGIVHRDLKPDNLFLTKDGRLKILDFGLAKLTQADSSEHTAMATATHHTEAGMVLGTAGYMSPEQVRGVAVDARSDIFAFGAILYEMLSGKRAFHGDTAADTMSAILKDDPPDLAETNRNISPALDRIVQHCLEKNPESRFHSASDIAFDLEHLSGLSGSSARIAQVQSSTSKTKTWLTAAIVGLAALATLAVGWWLGGVNGRVSVPGYKQITFRTGAMGNARFTPDGSIVYSANWDGGDKQMYTARSDDPGARELGFKNAELLSISKNGELAIRLRTSPLGGYAAAGTLARVPLSGGTPREVLDNVQDVDWAADGENMAVIRRSPENSHWRLEYPIGKVLIDGITWISHPKISPDGKWVAFADHENPTGDDQGSIAVIAADGNGKEKKLSSGWTSLEGVLWSPKGDEVWFSASDAGSANNPRAATLSGKVRTITNVPGGVWLHDIRNGVVLAVAQHTRLGIKGVAPGSTQEKELGWFGWAELRDISRDGHKILFEEESDGGGPNYTVFLRDTDGSPPSRIGEGTALALSPDAKWALTTPAKGGALYLIPTGAGEARQLTHDNVAYSTARWFPDGKRIMASGIEHGHGPRSYILDMNSGDSKAITPEGVSGARLAPDGSAIPVLGPDGKYAIWPIAGGGARPIPGLDSTRIVIGWTQDSKFLYAIDGTERLGPRKVEKVDPVTGKITPWRTFGDVLAATGAVIVSPRFANDGTTYAYMYVEVSSQGYVVTGMK